jgi:polyferredoxin
MLRRPDSRTGWIVRISIAMALCVLAAAVAWAQEEAGERKPLSAIDVILLPKVWVGAIFCAIGAALLIAAKAKRTVRLLWLGLAFFAFGVLGALPLGSVSRGMGLHPSPVCTITRPFQFVDAGRAIPIAFIVLTGAITVFTLAGNKLFCGWVCPLGALQEAVQRLPLPKKYRFMLPFRVTNTVRVLAFIVFVVVVFATGTSIYDYFNPFEGLHWSLVPIGTTALAVTVIVALFMFRPFCYLLCPIGLYTWVLEHISLTRMRLKKDECTMCNVCVQKTNCPAVPAILAEKKSRPDCHACGECMNVCPKNALEWR